VLLLDALNQLEATPRARQLTWLPRMLPANVRLIATALPARRRQCWPSGPAAGSSTCRP